MCDARSSLPEIYLCHTCSCHEMLTMETPGQVAALRSAIGPSKKLVAVLVHGGTLALSDTTLGALDAVLDAW
jgi:hypothetical protein